jgi:hypothetical protein
MATIWPKIWQARKWSLYGGKHVACTCTCYQMAVYIQQWTRISYVNIVALAELFWNVRREVARITVSVDGDSAGCLPDCRQPQWLLWKLLRVCTSILYWTLCFIFSLNGKTKQTMIEKMCYLLAFCQWLLYTYSSLTVTYAIICHVLSNIYAPFSASLKFD